MTVVVSPEVEAALAAGRPLVALETTIVSHGMPWPENIETALAVEGIVREGGAIPAAIAVLDGDDPGRPSAATTSSGWPRPTTSPSCRAPTWPGRWSSGRPGATTVAATMIVAARAGIPVFATGGIGGVHRGAEQSFDISADLTELARTGVTVVAAGAKALLDLPKTLEMLETLGVPVVCYRTDQFPAFWSRSSGLKAPLRLDDASAIAGFVRAREALALGGGILVANPVPEPDEIPAGEMDGAYRRRIPRQHRGRNHRQGGNALPARRDPEAHRRPQPRHQHRADQEQRPSRGGDRGGAGGRIGLAPGVTPCSRNSASSRQR